MIQGFDCRGAVFEWRVGEGEDQTGLLVDTPVLELEGFVDTADRDDAAVSIDDDTPAEAISPSRWSVISRPCSGRTATCARTRSARSAAATTFSSMPVPPTHGKSSGARRDISTSATMRAAVAAGMARTAIRLILILSVVTDARRKLALEIAGLYRPAGAQAVRLWRQRLPADDGRRRRGGDRRRPCRGVSGQVPEHAGGPGADRQAGAEIRALKVPGIRPSHQAHDGDIAAMRVGANGRSGC
jgi:hypothetical protein